MGGTSRRKGKKAESELAKALKKLLHTKARRGQQFRGSPDSPDVVVESLPNVHIECKRRKRMAGIYKMWRQAESDAGEKIPTVCLRADREPWLTIVATQDLVRLAEEIHAAVWQEE